jgi:hypothetical protein
VKYVNRFKVAPGSKVKLKDIDPGFRDHYESHKDSAEEIEQDRKKLRELQGLLYADGRCSLLSWHRRRASPRPCHTNRPSGPTASGVPSSRPHFTRTA